MPGGSAAATARSVVISGGSSGIGAAIVAALVPDWDVTVIDRDPPTQATPGVTYVGCDITSDQTATAIGASLADRGQSTIDAIVHCAGIGVFGSFLEMPRQDWERVLQVNLHGTLNFIQSTAGKVADGGRIVLFSSGTVFKGPPHSAAYAASKAGVMVFARSLAAELGERNITVNVVAPGLVLTPLAKDLAVHESRNISTRAIKRPATVEDFVEPVKFFLSPGASFVTGQTLVVDGGSIRR